MLITRTSPFTGKTVTKDLPITEDQYDDWQNGTLIQRAFPHLSPGDREFIKTGITEQEWDRLFN